MEIRSIKFIKERGNQSVEEYKTYSRKSIENTILFDTLINLFYKKMKMFDWMNNSVKVAEKKAARDVATWPDKKSRDVHTDQATSDDRIDYSAT